MSNILFLIQGWNCYWQHGWLWAISCFFFRAEIVMAAVLAMSNILFLFQGWNCYWQQCWLWALSCLCLPVSFSSERHSGQLNIQKYRFSKAYFIMWCCILVIGYTLHTLHFNLFHKFYFYHNYVFIFCIKWFFFIYTWNPSLNFISIYLYQASVFFYTFHQCY